MYNRNECTKKKANKKKKKEEDIVTAHLSAVSIVNYKSCMELTNNWCFRSERYTHSRSAFADLRRYWETAAASNSSNDSERDPIGDCLLKIAIP